MLIPGLSGYEGRVRRRLAEELARLGIAVAHRPARQSDRDARGRPDAPERHAVRAYGPARLRRAQDRGERPRPRRAARRRAGEGARRRRRCSFCVGEGRDVPGVIANKSHHATTPEEKYRVLPYPELYVDAGFDSAEDVLAAGIDIGTPVVYAPQRADACRRPHRRHVDRRPRRLRRDRRGGACAEARRASARPCTSSSRCRRSSTCAAR